MKRDMWTMPKERIGNKRREVVEYSISKTKHTADATLFEDDQIFSQNEVTNGAAGGKQF